MLGSVLVLMAGYGSERKAVVQGSLKQMRPALMMIAVATLGMIPAAGTARPRAQGLLRAQGLAVPSAAY